MSEEPETQAENVFHRWHFVNKSNRAFLALSVIIVGFISAYIHFLPYLHLFLLLLITEDEWNWMLCSDCLFVPVTILHCITTFNGYIIYILRHVKEKKNNWHFQTFEIFLSFLRYYVSFFNCIWTSWYRLLSYYPKCCDHIKYDHMSIHSFVRKFCHPHRNEKAKETNNSP